MWLFVFDSWGQDGYHEARQFGFDDVFKPLLREHEFGGRHLFVPIDGLKLLIVGGATFSW